MKKKSLLIGLLVVAMSGMAVAQHTPVPDLASVCRGRGRLVVDEVAGATKRGRISLVLTRYSVQPTDRREDGGDAYAT